MLKRNLKLALYSGMIVIAAYSCKPAEVAPVNSAEVQKPSGATALSTSEAGTTLTNASTNYAASQVRYTANVSTVQSALSSLTSSSSTGVPSEFAPSLSGRLSGEGEQDGDLLQSISDELGQINFLTSVDAAGRRLPLDFESAKGTWELVVEKRASTDTSGNASGVNILYCGSKKFNKYFKQTSTTGDKIIIKFSTNSRFSSSCDTTLINNAEYVISKLTKQAITYNYCNGTSSVSRTYDAVTALESSLKVDGKEVMSYSMSSSYSGSNRSSQTATGKFGTFEYSYTASQANSTYNYEFTWKEGGAVVLGTKYYVEIDGNISEFNNESADCSKKVTAKDRIAILKRYKKYDTKQTYGDLSLYTSADVKGFLTDFEEKYKSNIDADGLLDTAGYRKLQADSVLLEKYYTAELFTSNGSSKIGKIVSRTEKVKSEGSSFSYSQTVSYIVFADGTKEKVTQKFKYGIYAYNPLLGFIQVKYPSYSGDQK